MAYSTIQNSVYTNYLTTYGSQDVSKYDAHKRSELRNLYNSMVKLNKNSPLYLIPDAKDAAQSAVGLKEMARGLRNEIASMGGLDEGNLLNQKSAYSSNESIASAVYIGQSANGTSGTQSDIALGRITAQQELQNDALSQEQAQQELIDDAFLNDTVSDLPGAPLKAASVNPVLSENIVAQDTQQTDSTAVVPSYKIAVRSLASGQTNLGEFLPSDSNVSLPSNTYSFDIAIHNLSYEFQFNINKDDTNKTVQNRLSRLISNSGIGLKASVIDGDGHLSALKITSDTTGVAQGADSIFSFSENNTSRATGAVGYFGLGYVAVQPVNAVFLLDGEEHESQSNHFTLNNDYDITLNGVSASEGESATIGIKKDFESLTENINHLFSSYNDFIRSVNSQVPSGNVSADSKEISESQASGTQAASSSAGTSQTAGKRNSFNTTKLQSEMRGIASLYREQLQTIGVTLEDDGTLDVSKDAIAQAAQNTDAENQFRTVKNFTTDLLRKTDQISLDPLQYATKAIVAYKNPGHNYAAPYVSSNYSGMLYNFYC